MSDFTNRPSQSERVPSILVSRVAGFSDSPEYREMRDYELAIPGVVCSHFAKYLQRLHKEQARGNDNEMVRSGIQSAHEVLNSLASSHETDVLVTDEVFESFDCSPEVLERIKAHLKPNALALYRRWGGEASV
jgi:hypothetical protein